METTNWDYLIEERHNVTGAGKDLNGTNISLHVYFNLSIKNYTYKIQNENQHSEAGQYMSRSDARSKHVRKNKDILNIKKGFHIIQMN